MSHIPFFQNASHSTLFWILITQYNMNIYNFLTNLDIVENACRLSILRDHKDRDHKYKERDRKYNPSLGN